MDVCSSALQKHGSVLLQMEYVDVAVIHSILTWIEPTEQLMSFFLALMSSYVMMILTLFFRNILSVSILFYSITN